MTTQLFIDIISERSVLSRELWRVKDKSLSMSVHVRINEGNIGLLLFIYSFF